MNGQPPLLTTESQETIAWSDLELGPEELALSPEQMDQMLRQDHRDGNVSSDGEFTRIADREATRLALGTSNLPSSIPEEPEIKMEDNSNNGFVYTMTPASTSSDTSGQVQYMIPQPMYHHQQTVHNVPAEPTVPSLNPSLPMSPDLQSLCRANAATSQSPAVSDFPGDWNFGLTIPSGTKSKEPQYCQELSKLFLNQHSGVKIQFQIHPPADFVSSNGTLPAGVFIRAVMVFTRHDDFPNPVYVCPSHAYAKGGEHISHNCEHVIRTCPESQGYYFKDSNSGRCCVLTKVPDIQPGSDHVPISFQFNDLSSCTGGINRRDTAVIFTLEYSGNIIGRKVLNVRICTCIKRDMKNGLGMKRKSASVTEAKSGNSSSSGDAQPPSGSGGAPMTGQSNKGKVPLDKDKRKGYWVLTYGEDDFNAVKSVAERLVIANGGNVQKWADDMRRANNIGSRSVRRTRTGEDVIVQQQQQAQLQQQQQQQLILQLPGTFLRSGSDTDTAPENNSGPPAKRHC